MRELLRHSVATLRSPRLVALHLAGNAALLVAASFWLLIPEAHVWQLLFAGLSALLIAFTFLWIHSGTLVYGVQPAAEKFRDAFSPRVGRLLWLSLGFLVLFSCMWRVNGCIDSIWQISGYTYSKMPSWLRPTLGPAIYASGLEDVFTIVVWYVLPCVFLPVIAARVAGSNALHALRTLVRWKYWVAMAVAAFLGLWVTHRIVGWVPGSTLGEQTVSLVLRIGLAYVLATAAWLFTAGVLGYFVVSSSDALQPRA